LSNDKSLTALLTSTELEWLSGKKKISKVYEYRIRSNIKKKLQVFQLSELPLLVQNGFINELSVFTQLSANPQNDSDVLSLTSKHNNNDNHYSPYEKMSLGREFQCDSTLLDSRPFPYQGNALPG
jgi:hypothetical protein